MKKFLFFLFLLFAPTAAQINCNNAPNDGVRWICSQILNWDQGSRTRPLVQPAPTAQGLIGAAGATPSDTYQCQNITCICDISRGNGGENCVLSNGQPYRRVQRKELRMMTDAELQRYAAAMWAVKNNGEYNALSQIHSNVQVSPGAHSGPAFMPWHREFLKRLEISLRRIDPSVFIPYWDSTIDYRLPDPTDSVLWSSELMGYESSDGQVRNGLFANWPYLDNSRTFRRNRGAGGSMFSPTDLANVYAQTQVVQVLGNTAPRQACPTPAAWTALEYEHGNPHLWVGGDMANIPTSTNDPVFYSHHAFIDYIWEQWRLSRQSRTARATAYPPDDINCHSQAHNSLSAMQPFTPFVNTDGLSNMYTDSLYTYALSPTCSAANTNGCNSKYLFCDFSHGAPACTSKVVIGGNCQGFVRGEPVCYQGVCSGGVCVGSATQPTQHPTQPTQPPATQCYNENVCCATWAAGGQCQRSASYMRANCMASCAICTPNYNLYAECSDRSTSCSSWSQRGECTGSNAAWMRENCRVSCNYCGSTRAQDCSGGTTGGPTVTVAPTTASPSTTCLNQHYCCPVYAQFYCNNPTYSAFMSQNCGPACRYCSPPSGYNQCVDLSPSCRSWAAAGYCQSYYTYMYENCKVSCDTCALLNYNTRLSACGGSGATSFSAPAIGTGARPNPRPRTRPTRPRGRPLPGFPNLPDFPRFPGFDWPTATIGRRENVSFLATKLDAKTIIKKTMGTSDPNFKPTKKAVKKVKTTETAKKEKLGSGIARESLQRDENLVPKVSFQKMIITRTRGTSDHQKPTKKGVKKVKKEEVPKKVKMGSGIARKPAVDDVPKLQKINFQKTIITRTRGTSDNEKPTKKAVKKVKKTEVPKKAKLGSGIARESVQTLPKVNFQKTIITRTRGTSDHQKPIKKGVKKVKKEEVPKKEKKGSGIARESLKPQFREAVLLEVPEIPLRLRVNFQKTIIKKTRGTSDHEKPTKKGIKKVKKEEVPKKEKLGSGIARETKPDEYKTGKN